MSFGLPQKSHMYDGFAGKPVRINGKQKNDLIGIISSIDDGFLTLKPHLVQDPNTGLLIENDNPAIVAFDDIFAPSFLDTDMYASMIADYPWMEYAGNPVSLKSASGNRFGILQGHEKGYIQLKPYLATVDDKVSEVDKTGFFPINGTQVMGIRKSSYESLLVSQKTSLIRSSK